MQSARIALSGFLFLGGIACQLSARADDPILEEIVVTGTRIARPDFDAASPIVAVPAAAFERTASGTAETTLNLISAVRAGYTGTSNNAGNLNAYSEGRAGLNLRGLGDNRTLTLVDGRRLTPVNANGETDLNVIPPALIESVEVVTGGASAVYGSDAIAGVVNFRLRHEFDGVEVGGRWGQTDRGDGEEYDISLTAGTDFADGRGSVARLCRLLRSCSDQLSRHAHFSRAISVLRSAPATAHWTRQRLHGLGSVSPRKAWHSCVCDSPIQRSSTRCSNPTDIPPERWPRKSN